jgi:SNF2 family DNA or RNA helicase
MSATPVWFADRDTGEVLAEARIVEQPASRLFVLPPVETTGRTLAIDPVAPGRAGSISLAGLAPWDALHRPERVDPDDEDTQDDELKRANAPWPDSPEGIRAWLVLRLATLLQLPLSHLLADDGALDWPGPLRSFQLRGVRALLGHDALLLADDMGLGKTVQALAALRILVVQRRVNAALVVAPAGLLSQWRAECRRWAPELRVSTVHGTPADRRWQWRTPAHVYLTSYETLRADVAGSSRTPLSREWDLVILDEAHRIKNAESDISWACKRLRRRRQWALTGTPLENSADDLVSILEFVRPEWRGQRRHLDTFAGLRAELREVQLRRRKADVLPDLPDKLVSVVPLPLAPRQRETYERIEREGIVELRERGEQARVQNVMELIQRLKQVCNFCPRSGESSKFDDLRERLATLAAEGHKALVFTQFTNVTGGARAIARRLGGRALIYTGGQTPAERDEVLRRFRSDDECSALVLSLRAGGHGLNLPEASYVFHFDRWWNPAVEAQAEGRSHRLGQRRAVNVYSYVCERTIEERIAATLAAKRILFDELVDDVSLDLAAHLSADDLFGLFGLPAPDGA